MANGCMANRTSNAVELRDMARRLEIMVNLTKGEHIALAGIATSLRCLAYSFDTESHHKKVESGLDNQKPKL
jgi:hypothetical protein